MSPRGDIRWSSRIRRMDYEGGFLPRGAAGVEAVAARIGRRACGWGHPASFGGEIEGGNQGIKEQSGLPSLASSSAPERVGLICILVNTYHACHPPPPPSPRLSPAPLTVLAVHGAAGAHAISRQLQYLCFGGGPPSGCGRAHRAIELRGQFRSPTEFGNEGKRRSSPLAMGTPLRRAAASEIHEPTLSASWSRCGMNPRRRQIDAGR